MRCDRILRLMDVYLDGRLAPRSRARLEIHLCACGPCRVVIDTVRRTIRLYRAGRPVTLPAACRLHLHRRLRARWELAPKERAKRAPSGRAL